MRTGENAADFSGERAATIYKLKCIKAQNLRTQYSSQISEHAYKTTRGHILEGCIFHFKVKFGYRKGVGNIERSFENASSKIRALMFGVCERSDGMGRCKRVIEEYLAVAETLREMSKAVVFIIL